MNIKGGITKKQENNNQIRDLVRRMEPQIKKALPNVITPERFTRMVVTALSTNPTLQECTPMSFIGAMMQAAQLGLEPNTPVGQAYLIPYRVKGTLTCQFQIGYKGMLDLVYRSGQVKDVQAHAVHENDTFEYELGLEPKLRHVPALSNRGAVIMYYAVVRMISGGAVFQVMSKDDIAKFAHDKSQAYKFGPWQTDFDAMALKTVLKRALKYAPIKSDLAREVSADGTVKPTLSGSMLDEPDEDYIDIEASHVDPETGEVTPPAEPAKEDTNA